MMKSGRNCYRALTLHDIRRKFEENGELKFYYKLHLYVYIKANEIIH